MTNASPGYLDRNGDLVLALRPKWGSGDFHEGFAWVKTRKNGYLEDIYGYMDKTGELVIPFQYQYASDFSEGLARVQDSTSGLYGFVDQTGAEVIPCQYHKASSFSDGMAAIGDEQGLYGFIDREGNTVIACQFTQVDSFSQGLAGAKGENGSWGFIDKTGRWVIPARYSRILGFSEGLAPVAVFGNDQVRRWGYVDQTGAEVIPCQYTIVLGFSEGLAAAYTPVNGLWGFIDKGGYIDKAGNVVVPFQYEWAGSFSDGYALAKKELPEDDLVILHIEEGPAPRAVAVNKTDNGDVSVSASQASGGETVTVTVKPDSGYALETVTVLDKDGKALALTDKGSGRYTFTMPDCDVAVRAAFRKDSASGSAFRDVAAGDYYREAVEWAVEKGITSGVGNGLFAPNQPCTRAQIVTFLWRAAGSPEPKAANSFADVAAGSYYAKAVAWAVENGITSGTGDGKFSPDATCTRAQAMTFLYRASGAPAISGNAAFNDVATNAYYAAAVKWAEKNGITGGIGGGLFGSDNDCTRAQIVTFLYRNYQSK